MGATDVITKNDSDEIWQSYYASINELVGFEERADAKKRVIICDIRDCVVKLVLSNLISIREDQIAIYVWNQLEEKGIKYSKGHFYSEFEENQKRNYSKSSIGNSHKHKWKILSDTKNGLWETCKCGTNKIDGIEQADAVNTEEKQKSRQVSEVVIPKNIQYELLLMFEEIAYNNIKIIKMIRQKTSINKTILTKQTDKKLTQSEKDKRENDVETLVNKRIKIVIDGINEMGNPGTILKDANGVITQQLQAMKYFDDRASLTHWQKLMAIFAVAIGYNQNEIAKTIGITAKHMKINVMEAKSGANTLLQDLNWVNRCPNPDCGIVMSDYVESKINNFKAGKSLGDIEDFELEPLLPTGYQKQVIVLQEKIRKLKNK